MEYSEIGWKALVQDSKYTNHTEVYILNGSYLSKLLLEMVRIAVLCPPKKGCEGKGQLYHSE